MKKEKIMNEKAMLKELKTKYEEYLSVLNKSYALLLTKDFVDENGTLINDASYSTLASHLNNVKNSGNLIMNMEIDEFDDICVKKENK